MITATDDLSERIAALHRDGIVSERGERTDVTVSERADLATGAPGDTPEERLARWTSRDAAIGLAAQRDQLRSTLAERDREVADLRERLAHLTNANGQLRADVARLTATSAAHVPLWRRAYLGLRRRVGRLVRA